LLRWPGFAALVIWTKCFTLPAILAESRRIAGLRWREGAIFPAVAWFFESDFES
jgi:hypothetical protein